MNNTMDYKGYIGSIEFSEKDGAFYGKVMGTRALISYEGESVKEFVEDFLGAVESYLALCEEQGVKPEKINNDDPVGDLMLDFRCTDADDMNYSILADRIRYLKKAKEQSKL